MSSRQRHAGTVCRVPVLWLYGADAVGKSTVGWAAYRRLVDHGVPAAYLDTDYLGFCTPQFADRARLVELNLAATWPNFAVAGAECLVVSGIVVTAEQRDRFERAVVGGRLTLCRLHAQPATIRSRILSRARVEAESAGAELSDAVLTGLHEYGDRSVAFAEALAADDISDLVLHTDRATPAQLAEAALRHGSWPSTLAHPTDRAVAQ
jgi:hypothetical protein